MTQRELQYSKHSKKKLKQLKNHVLNVLKNELSDKLTYHNVNHTQDVLNSCNQYIKRMEIAPEDAYLLRTAALMHDLGFIRNYDNHEEESKKYVREMLPEWGYSDAEIKIIQDIINATKIPQKPGTILEQILADSDLDYLGTDSFFETGETLYKELIAHNKISNRMEWNNLQIKFLQEHAYHTPFAKKYREPVKQQNLKTMLETEG